MLPCSILNCEEALAFERQIEGISCSRHLTLGKINLIAAKHAVVIDRRVQLGTEGVRAGQGIAEKFPLGTKPGGIGVGEIVRDRIERLLSRQ